MAVCRADGGRARGAGVRCLARQPMTLDALHDAGTGVDSFAQVGRMAGMSNDDCVIWPSTLPPCPVAASWVTAIQIAMAQQIDEMWKPTTAEGFPFKEIDWTPTKPTHRTGGPDPTAMKFEPPTN